MSNQSQQKPSQNANQSNQSSQSNQSQQGNRADATKSWDKDSSAKSGMKNEPTSQNRDQFRSDASKK